MAKPTEQSERHSWSIHRSTGRWAHLIGIVHYRSDEQAAIKLAIEQFKIPESQRTKLIARRLDRRVGQLAGYLKTRQSRPCG
jgi:hypothetical protein